MQDVVDAVVGIVGPAVRISVRAIEHAVVSHNHRHAADRAATRRSCLNVAAAAAGEPEISVNAEPSSPATLEVPAPAEQGPPAAAAEAPSAAPRPFIHGRHTCDGCLTTPIVGERYHCLDLPDFDFCKACYDKYDGPHKFEPVELGAYRVVVAHDGRWIL
jgi:Zinc finger, ZZ type